MSQIYSPSLVKKQSTHGSSGKRCNDIGGGLLADESSCSAKDENNGNTNSNKASDDGKAVAQVMERSQWKINTDIRSKRIDYDRICSICLSEGGKFTRKDNPLISACLCLGFRSNQHKLCIEEWIEQTGTRSCPFCFVTYDYARKRKSFWSYIIDCELEYEFSVSLLALALGIYLFLTGLSVSYYSIVSADNNIYASWLSLILFSFVSTSTLLLMIGILSTGLNLIFRHYIRYWLWSRTHFKVDIKSCI